ncbi:hypothetical protein FRC02_005432 [Tulasnella sp. 418]|nr:hypothetical protein FRC02_005432 [Tulasnella sp. 418]
MPAPNKAMDKEGRGYDAYDLVMHPCWDLGEFSHKGRIATRWGTKAELLESIKIAKANGMGVLIDAVLNHKLGADRTETFPAVECDPDNRLRDNAPVRNIKAWTAFDFPARGDKYSSMKWTQEHFTGVDWDELTKKKAIYRIVGQGHKGWSKKVDTELGNYDYLLGIDIDFRHEAVRNDMFAWGSWVLQETGATGFRLDACKHIDYTFLRQFVLNARKQPGYERAFVVAEFWIDSVHAIERYMNTLRAPVSMFDVPLHHNFYRASEQGSKFDLRTILDGSLVQHRPNDAVTFVDNHDTAVGCSLESWVSGITKLIAYALILLRPDGHPCVYHADLYGEGTVSGLPELMKARKLFAYGPLVDYFDDAHCIGFVRKGDDTHPHGCVVLCANDGTTAHEKKITVGAAHEGTSWKDLLGQSGRVSIIAGIGTFTCPASGVAVWVRE